MEKKYSIAQARQQFSAIVREAERTSAVSITRRGQVVARLVLGHESMRGTDLTSCPGRNRSSRQSKFSSIRILTSDVGEDFRFHFFEHGQHLRTFHAGEAFEKNFDGIAGLEMVEQTLHRHARAFEDQRAAQDFRVAMVSALLSHGGTIRPFDMLGKGTNKTEIR